MTPFEALQTAKRPLIAFGAGMRHAAEEARLLVNRLGIPFVVTWGARDLFCESEPLLVGPFGTHGTKPANLAVQNCDWLLTIGTRLDTKATGSPVSSFAPNAKRFMVDIDQGEIDKFELLKLPITGICQDSKQFLSEFYSLVLFKSSHDLNAGTWKNYDWIFWQVRCSEWKTQYPIILPEYEQPDVKPCLRKINPYVFVKQLSKALKPDDVIVSDTGCVLAWMMQAFEFQGQRFIHAHNNTPMGYGLPAAMGAAFATSRRVVLVTGDGGLSVNITELATVSRHSLPIKIILFNNRGHAMCRQTQRQWLGGSYPATSYEGGLACPDYHKVAHAYDILAHDSYFGMMGRDGKTRRCTGADQAKNVLPDFLGTHGPDFMELEIAQDQGVYPQIKFGESLAEAA